MKNKGIILLFTTILLLLFAITVDAGLISITSSKNTVEPGEIFNVKINGKNAAGRIDLKIDNGTLSSKMVWVDNSSEEISVIAGHEGKLIITAVSTDISDSDTATEIKGSTSTTITVKKAKNTLPTTETNKVQMSKEEMEKEIVYTDEEKEEVAESKFGISKVMLKGIKENGEEVDLVLDKDFNIDIFEYFLEVDANIKSIQIQKEAYEYSEFVTIFGLENDLVPGENIITLNLFKEGKNEKNYIIKVNKEKIADVEEKQEEVTIKEENANDKNQTIYFILLGLVIVGVSIVGIVFLIKRK